MKNSEVTSTGLLWRLLQQARPYWLHLAGILSLSVLATPLTLLAPIPVKIVVDNVVGSDPLPAYLDFFIPNAIPRSQTSLLMVAAGLMMGVGLVSQLRSRQAQILQVYTGERLVLGLRGRLFRHMQRLSFGYHDRAGTGDSAYRIQNDAGCIQRIFIHTGIPLLTSAFPLIGVMGVVGYIDFDLTLVALSTVPVLVLLIRFFGVRMRKKWKKVNEMGSASMSVVHETLSALRVVKAFGREDTERDRFADRSDRKIRSQMDATRLGITYRILVGFTTTGASSVILYVGTLHVMEGILSLGELLMVIAYIGQIFGPLRTMTQSTTGLSNALSSAERVFDVLDQAPEVENRPDARSVERVAGGIEFVDVTFSYQPEHPVLRNVTFDVAAGSRVGIQGSTGAGKSTLLSLMMRFSDPDSGRILLDGVDLRDYRLEDLRNQFAMVLQEPVLFSTSLRENIAYARAHATDEEVIQAARLANADDFIMSLPKGYDTEVGERGMMLSGGERQRISLARAFLKDAPILVLDEPTSSVDVNTEKEILDALQRLMGGRTTFMIAHRLSTLGDCNVRLEMEGGNLRRTSPRQEAAKTAGQI
jgi:ATP-binding cassette subfamily B protein